jgi:uncharacterized protein (TIGR00251 family)
VTPRSRNEGVEIEGGEADRRIRVRVSAPPADGKANDAVVALLAARLGVAGRAVRVVGGATARQKWIEVDGLGEEEAWRRLEAK